jgi:hypothetical protein
LCAFAFRAKLSLPFQTIFFGKKEPIMVASTGASKPRIIDIGGLSLVGGVLTILGSLGTIGVINAVQAQGVADPAY